MQGCLLGQPCSANAEPARLLKPSAERVLAVVMVDVEGLHEIPNGRCDRDHE